MRQSITQRWLSAWGYAAKDTDTSKWLHVRGQQLAAHHPYRGEIAELLNPEGPIKATAVFDVEGMPTVCFLEDNGALAESPSALDRIREAIWNQNLISIAFVLDDQKALVVPAATQKPVPESTRWEDANPKGPYSASDIGSGEIFRRHPSWFTPEERVDQHLLRNLGTLVNELSSKKIGMTVLDAQYLVAQVLFISFLEHRSIIADPYRAKHQLQPLHNLIGTQDRTNIIRLLSQLKQDFNGDFLEPEGGGSSLWKSLSSRAFVLLNEFLKRTDLHHGQCDLWRYDFSHIPVELLSGIYESFLSDQKKEVGAYYTPRNLANLAVDHAFAGVPDILSETIYDGACGSGILLTTAYRRMLSYAEATRGEPLSFSERSNLLTKHIFGSDLSESACRVTAFSLYLSMLEGLAPTDIAQLQDNEQVKLPPLSKTNIIGGAPQGEFFSEKNPLAESGKFTLFLSNPPWLEPKKHEVLGSDRWAARASTELPRRQVAAAFMLRVKQSLTPGGRFCLILPISVIAAPTSRHFIKTWLGRYRLETLINFGDLRKVLFHTAKQPCVVAAGRPRTDGSTIQVPADETFEYWVPKADISFAFGRLTLHGLDRHTVHTRAVQMDNELLTTLYWGTERDVANISDLRLQGTLDDLIGTHGPWSTRKGFHKHDATINDPIEPMAIRSLLYLNAKNLEGPVLELSRLTKFPEDIKTVARLPTDLLDAFRGPKIVFTDGMTKERRIQAAYSSIPFSFSSSIGVIQARAGDEALLRFIAAYLHSSLAQYMLALTAYQANFERERVTLRDIKRLPFIHPDQHNDPKKAWEIVKKIAEKLRFLEANESILSQSHDAEETDRLIAEYFGLGTMQAARINEVSKCVAPYLQPGTITNFNSPLQQPPNLEKCNEYATALRGEILNWSKARGGKGDVSVYVQTHPNLSAWPVAVIGVRPAERSRRSANIFTPHVDDKIVQALFAKLREEQLYPLTLAQGMDLAPDVIITIDDSYYLIKPLISRFWLMSEAYRDAERIVRRVLKEAVRESA